MGKITLISGGINSGKSDFAEKLARSSKFVTYVALSEFRNNDKTWLKKILIHKSKRPKHWNTIETVNIFEVLNDNNNGFLLIDSIGGFVLDNIKVNNNDWEVTLKKLISKLINYNNEIIIVGEQAGWGLVSEYEIGNIFIERIGDVLREITKISEENWLTINGKAIRLDNIFYDL